MSERVRFMRLIVFFDLPTETAPQRREYARFRKFLLKNGYLMLQKSVYTKLAIDGRMYSSLVARLEENKPPEGLVQAMLITEKQYADMVCIVGGGEIREEIENTDALVVL